MMNPQRFAVAAVLSFSAVYASERIVWFAGLGSAGAATNGAAQVVDRLAPQLAANVASTKTLPVPAPASAPAATDKFDVGTAELAAAAELVAQVAVAPKAQDKLPASDKQALVVVAALSDPAEVLPEAAPRAATAEIVEPPAEQNATTPARPRVELVGECMVAQACIDQYLFALYERTPKEDSIKETERRKVAVKRKGKTVMVTRSFTRLVDNDFTWKDPKAAERVNMSMIDYVIGGMDKSFKLKLFYMLQAAENAGLQPGITSAFRDDYRQAIASGLKAASDRSYHGGSTRGGYGHGMAADITSVNGASRAKRWTSTEALWKWVDKNGKDYGVGRPYLDRDPPHVGPIDGQEYVSKRGGAKAADVRKRGRQASHERPAAAKPPVAAASARGRTMQAAL
jgi:hypothetical protein